MLFVVKLHFNGFNGSMKSNTFQGNVVQYALMFYASEKQGSTSLPSSATKKDAGNYALLIPTKKNRCRFAFIFVHRGQQILGNMTITRFKSWSKKVDLDNKNPLSGL